MAILTEAADTAAISISAYIQELAQAAREATPGNWCVDPDDPFTIVTVSDGRESCICSTADKYYDAFTDEQENEAFANARLIAGAKFLAETAASQAATIEQLKADLRSLSSTISKAVLRIDPTIPFDGNHEAYLADGIAALRRQSELTPNWQKAI